MKRAKVLDVLAAQAAREHNQQEVFISRAQLAQRHGTTVETIKRRQANGMFVPYKIGRQVRYKLSEIVAFENSARS
jgi:hypothetical protein